MGAVPGVFGATFPDRRRMPEAGTAHEEALMARTPAAKSETKPKRPKRPPAIKERMTKAAMVQEMAERTELSKGQVESVLSELESVIERHVRSRAAGEFVLPGLFKISRAKRKAQKKKTGRNPATGEEIVIAAKPAQTVIRVRPLKRLRDMA